MKNDIKNIKIAREGRRSNSKKVWTIIFSVIIALTVVLLSIICYWEMTHNRKEIEKWKAVATAASKNSSVFWDKWQACENHVLSDYYTWGDRVIGTGCFEQNRQGFYAKDINFDEANTYLIYEGKGIRFNIPYNNDWGNNFCYVRPYVYYEGEMGNFDRLGFGLPRGWETPDEYILEFRPVESREDFLSEIRELDEWNSDLDYDIKEFIINGLNVVAYNDFGMHAMRYFVIFGKDYTYIFQVHATEEQISKLLELFKTVELI